MFSLKQLNLQLIKLISTDKRTKNRKFVHQVSVLEPNIALFPTFAYLQLYSKKWPALTLPSHSSYLCLPSGVRPQHRGETHHVVFVDTSTVASDPPLPRSCEASLRCALRQTVRCFVWGAALTDE
ncbi:hypothetical protein CDAR_435941 [Caerostris darwini]|uniref:Uncharacterized protein n=1 Tax=Caerostris darwini TaxID=1538125 RepID=A0AAV4SJS2_9ARAC|nr:hypothetical protein CDAR_435941 [Caerostris darwini]